ncbi:MmcQ/YjbR family DNA-binding protein [Anaerolentibacter hominis]|uniref:MmcQ/YjbR family DNA-binding protein n=1 Tax=Anaerolentibacter hominis TaxID=3079009 RepID=UPI0031B83A1E
MKTREDVIGYCLAFQGVYEDHPFKDQNWTLMRCRDNKKSFAIVYEREGIFWLNLKCSPQWAGLWRETYTSVIPAYHMNKDHWNTVILDGTVPEEEIRRMIGESYDLVKPKKKK